MDRFLPMQGSVNTADTWGADSVRPRLVDNGIEDRTHTYWGGNIIRGNDGLYHLFVAGWLENSPRGFSTWSQSDTYHAVSRNMYGPFHVVQTLGKGHNPEVYRAKNGTYVVYVIDGRYTSRSLYGPWKYSQFVFNRRDRKLLGGEPSRTGLSNITFAKRQDGSMLAIDRGGSIWISRDGLGEYQQLTDKRIYPELRGRFEDPVIWRDQLQYHCIVNDWLGRVAYYSRSADGVHWIHEEGEAYIPGVSFHKDGQVEHWYKYERIKIFQDAQGRAIQANFAVIDTIKNQDKASDNHSAKNICIPLNKGLLMEVISKSRILPTDKYVTVKIKSEKGFRPDRDIDFSSLVFASSHNANYGKGLKYCSYKKMADGILVTFSGDCALIDSDDFAPKMIGKRTDGTLLYGYARMPFYPYTPAIISGRRPLTNALDKYDKVEVKNYGLTASAPLSITVSDSQGTLLAQGTVGTLKPYEAKTVRLTSTGSPKEGSKQLIVRYYKGKQLQETNTFDI